MTSLQENKNKFLKRIQVQTPTQGLDNCLSAALQHNPTYIRTQVNRSSFRRALINELWKQTEIYRYENTEEAHIKTISDIANSLSEQYTCILHNGRLRIGTVQKALNLYLKILWCIEPDWPIPPHCPIDRIILQAAHIRGNWTRLDCVDTYKNWVSQLQVHAESFNYSSLSEWELATWNRS